MVNRISFSTYIRCQKIVNFLRYKPSSTQEIYQSNKSLYNDNDNNNNNHKSILRKIQRDFKVIERYWIKGISLKKNEGKYSVEIDRGTYSEGLLSALNIVCAFSAEGYSKELKDMISFDRKPFTGNHYLAILIEAIQRKNKVSFTFTEFERKPRKVELSIYGLKEFDHQWYVVGENSLNDNEVNRFGLNRCSDFVVLDKKSHNNSEFNLDEFFNGCYGVIRDVEEKNEGIHRVKFFADYRQSCYLKNSPLHPSQKFEDHKDGALRGSYFTLDVANTYDFRMKLLSFGNRITVLEPESLKKNILDTLKETMENYKI